MAITGFLITCTVLRGFTKRKQVRIVCQRNTPIPKPKTLITLNNGTYPAKSSIPKIKGTEKDAAINHHVVSCLLLSKLKSGNTLLVIGSTTLLILWSRLYIFFARLVVHPFVFVSSIWVSGLS